MVHLLLRPYRRYLILTSHYARRSFGLSSHLNMDADEISSMATDPDYPDANKIMIYVGLCSTAPACPDFCDSNVCNLPSDELAQVRAVL